MTMLILGYLVIFIAKITEVSLMTVRVVLITKGEKLIGSLIGLVEVSIWLVLVSSILTNLSKEPIKAIIYALGFATGNYIGTIIEDKIAIGTSTMNIIIDGVDREILCKALREKGFGVTEIEASGIYDERVVLITLVKRKRTKEAINLINQTVDSAVITINDTRTVYGAFGLIRK